MIVRTTSELTEINKLLDTQLEVAYDIESDGLNVRKNQIIGFSCASDGFSFYVIHKAWVSNAAYADGGFLEERIPKADLLPTLEKLKAKRIIGHNSSFDSRITHHYFGVELWSSIYFDTMLAAHTIDENRFNYGLKEIGAEVFGTESVAERDAMKTSIAENGGEKKQYYKADAELLALYGRKDAELTYNLYKYFKPRLAQQGLWDFFAKTEVMPLYTNVTIPMELTGVNIDEDFIKTTLSEITEEISKIESEIYAELNPILEPFNEWHRSKMYQVKLTGPFIQKFAELQGVDLPRTKTGNFSLTEKNISKLADCRFKDVYTKKSRMTDAEIKQVQLAMAQDADDGVAFNIQSPDHLKRLFFTILNETPLSRTKPSTRFPDGSPQADDKFLDAMAEKYGWAYKLRIYRKLMKLKSTYMERILDEQEDGVFYPEFNQHRTTSGRFSGDLQQLPRKKDEDEVPHPLVLKYVNRIRDFFISKPGWKFVDADYSSLEVVVFADDSQDEALLDIIRNDLDFYSQVAIEAEGIEGYSADKKADNFLKKHKPSIRQGAKAYALGIRYGEQPYKISKVLNISEARAKEIHSNYLTRFSKLAERMTELVTSAKTKGYVKSKAGRIRRLPELKQLVSEHGEVLFDGLALWKKFNETPATYKRMKALAGIAKNLVNNSLNFPIQSMAASIVSQASIAIMREFKEREMKAYIAMSVHDELCIHCPDNEVEAVKEIMQRRMENTIKLSVPLQAEPIVGTRYGDVK